MTENIPHADTNPLSPLKRYVTDAEDRRITMNGLDLITSAVFDPFSVAAKYKNMSDDQKMKRIELDQNEVTDIFGLDHETD